MLEAQKSKELTEFHILLQNAKTTLKGGNCPEAKTVEQIKATKIKYRDDADLQKQIEDILKDLKGCNY